MFPAATYVTRRADLRAHMDRGLVLLLGNTESPMNFADNTYPFRQDSTFLYFAGLDLPDLAVVLDLDAGSTTLFGDELTIDDIVWMGDRPTLAALAEQAGIDDVRPAAALDEIVGKACTTGRTIHALPPYRSSNRLRLAGLLDHSPDAVDDAVSRPLIEAVVALRSIKSAEEIAEIEQAVDLSVDMHTAAIRMARPGRTEAAIAAEVERVALAAGGRPSFPVIATVRGAVLHNHDHGGTLKSGDLFLLDAGAEGPRHYAGDLSSTFPVDPVFTGRQRIIYDLCLQAHEAALAAVAPGVPNLEVHLTAARTIAAGMKDLGLMRGDLDEAIAAGAHAMFFPCGVGHMMGLDVHDMEDLGEQWVGYGGKPKSTQFGLKSLRLARALEPGFVLTVEPGIYFIPQLIDIWRASGHNAEFLVFEEIDRWRDFGGIRNEENVLVTPDGKRVLGKPKPKTAAEIEALRTYSP